MATRSPSVALDQPGVSRSISPVEIEAGGRIFGRAGVVLPGSDGVPKIYIFDTNAVARASEFVVNVRVERAIGKVRECSV